MVEAETDRHECAKNGVGTDADSAADSVFLLPSYQEQLKRTEQTNGSPHNRDHDSRLSPAEEAAEEEEGLSGIEREILIDRNDAAAILSRVARAVSGDAGATIRTHRGITITPVVSVVDLNNRNDWETCRDEGKKEEDPNRPVNAVLFGIRGTF